MGEEEDALPCLPCDAGYFKDSVADGNGRCSDKCSLYYGFYSTSDIAAVSQFRCYCEVSSYMVEDSSKDSGYQCKQCPTKGVRCAGNIEANTSGDSENLTFDLEIHV